MKILRITWDGREIMSVADGLPEEDVIEITECDVGRPIVLEKVNRGLEELAAKLGLVLTD